MVVYFEGSRLPQSRRVLKTNKLQSEIGTQLIYIEGESGVKI
jgi:hypothetical protein